MLQDKSDPSLASLLLLLAMFTVPIVASFTIPAATTIVTQYGFGCQSADGCWISCARAWQIGGDMGSCVGAAGGGGRAPENL